MSRLRGNPRPTDDGNSVRKNIVESGVKEDWNHIRLQNTLAVSALEN